MGRLYGQGLGYGRGKFKGRFSIMAHACDLSNLTKTIILCQCLRCFWNTVAVLSLQEEPLRENIEVGLHS